MQWLMIMMWISVVPTIATYMIMIKIQFKGTMPTNSKYKMKNLARYISAKNNIFDYVMSPNKIIRKVLENSL